MNVNVNDISGFDATAEEIRQVYAERDRLREENEELRQFNEFRRGHERLKYNIKKQEEFTEEAASILGVQSGDLSLSDVLAALRKLKRFEELLDMNSEIITGLKDKRDKETSRRVEAERYMAEYLSKICSALGIEYSTDTTLEYILDTIDDLKTEKSCPKTFWEAMCDIMEMATCDSTPSDVVGMTRETKRRLISMLALNPDTATWTDIYDAIKAEQKDHCNLIAESYKMKNELEDLKKKSEDNKRSFVFSSVCDYLGFSADDATLSDIHDEIKRLKECEGKYRSLCDDVAWYYMELDLNYTQCNRAGVMAKINDMKTHMDALQKSTARHDRKRREWVRKYEEEHKRANSCDKLYKKYKALYDMDAPAREKLSDGLASYRASYEAVRNKAIKYRSLMNAAEKKANHWDILVDGYGKETIRSLFENIGIDVSGDKGNGLF